MTTYRLKAAGACPIIFLWDPILDLSYSHSSASEKSRSNPPQDIPLLQAWGIRP